MHPLQLDISKISDTELEEKIKELTKKYFTVMKVSPSASNQVLMLLEGYREEQEKREFARTQNRKDSYGGEFDDLINIG